MADEHYENLRLAEVYDLGNGWSEDNDFYLSLAGKSSMKILDLGCGTGTLCDAYAQKGHSVTGLDPAISMIQVARKKPNGNKIKWIHSPAQDFKIDEAFDLIVMTGHAFQVFLEKKDILNVFSNVKNHLTESGRFVFETRNPLIDWGTNCDGWGQELTFQNSKILINISVLSKKDPFIEFETNYAFPDESRKSNSKLRFWSAEEVKTLLEKSSLKVDQTYGDWDKSHFNSNASEEIIFISSIK